MIREIALGCRKLLLEQDATSKAAEVDNDISGVLVELSRVSESTDVEVIAIALLDHDYISVEQFARLLRTPGRITMH